MILHIFNNTDIYIGAQTLLIVIGSMLLGMLITYAYYKRVKRELETVQEEESKAIRKQEELRTQVHELLEKQFNHTEERDKLSETIIQQRNQINSHKSELESKKADTSNEERLEKLVSEYRQRLHIIESEWLKVKSNQPSIPTTPVASVSLKKNNYDHVTSLLGRSVTENDLTLISGIGPKTANLLNQAGINSWDTLAETNQEKLKEILEEGGGAFKALDPSHWQDQASMAAKGEWRKLRAFQSYLRSKSDNQETS